MTTPFPFVSGAVLTAAQLNAITEVPVSAKTSSYTLAATDAGSRITMSSASATTITVNTGLFTAGQSLRIQNLNGGGICTVTAGTATVTSAGPLALVAWAGGQLYFTSASAAVWFPDAVTATASGLTFVSNASPSAVNNVSINNCFSSTYQNYKVICAFSSSVGANATFTARLRASGTDTITGYSAMQLYQSGTSVGGSLNSSGTDEWYLGDFDPTNKSYYLQFDLQNPNIASFTSFSGNSYSVQSTGTQLQNIVTGYQSATTQFDGLTLLTSGTSFTGTIRVYGYANS
jgi:hypothetical protein